MIGWTASASDPWTQLDADSGSTPDVLRVSFVNTNLGVGSHEGTITFTSPDVDGQSEKIRVSLTITAEGLYLPIIIGYPGL